MKRVVLGLIVVAAGLGAAAWASGSHSIWARAGAVLWGLLILQWVVWLWRTRPERCPQGHTDIVLYWGQWSCRTCYRNARRRRSRSVRVSKGGAAVR